MAKAKFPDTSMLEAERAPELFQLREAFDDLLGRVDGLMKAGRYKSLGMTDLEGAKLWFEQAIKTEKVVTVR